MGGGGQIHSESEIGGIWEGEIGKLLDIEMNRSSRELGGGGWGLEYFRFVAG